MMLVNVKNGMITSIVYNAEINHGASLVYRTLAAGLNRKND